MVLWLSHASCLLCLSLMLNIVGAEIVLGLLRAVKAWENDNPHLNLGVP